MTKPIILLADNDEVFLENTREFLERSGYEVKCASTVARAKEILQKVHLAVAIIDIRLTNDDDEKDKSGLLLARETRHIQTPKIILTRYATVENTREALVPEKEISLAINFIAKEEGLEKLLDVIEQTLTKARIFLCYGHLDLEKVTSLYDDLAAAGFYPWMDKKKISGGERWEASISKAIRDADFCIICLSNDSVGRRGYFQKEINLVLDCWQEKLEDDIYVIPARLDECEINNERLKKLQRVDLFSPEGFEKLTQAIRAGIRKRI